MFDIQHYASFIAAIIIFQLVPGPGTLVILGATATHGIRGGLGAVVGTLSGDLIYMTAAVLGVAAVMQAHPLLFDALQWLGAAYLCWIGLRLLRPPVTREDAVRPRQQQWASFRRGWLVSMTNPKVVLFFMALFPLFLRADASVGTLVIMMAHVTGISFLYQLGLVLAGNTVARRLATRPRVHRLMRRLAAVVFIGFGIRLVLTDR